MKTEKKVISTLSKCYSIAPLFYQGKEHFLVAAEKQDPCYLFDMEGNKVDKIWDGPGGVMSMVQVPGTDGQYLSTCQFYSPNDSKEAKIVIVTPKGKRDWEVRTLAELPHVHRFDLLRRHETTWLLACTLKSGHRFKEDWSMPGKVYAAKLPGDLSAFCQKNQLKFQVLKENMTRNHGYYRVMEGDIPTAVISSQEGVFTFTPPETEEGEWKIETLLQEAVSDALLVDLDQDGEKELCTLAPFHGNKVSIYKKISGKYEKVYDFPENLEFVHAMYGGLLCGKPTFVVGHRGGEKRLIAIRYNRKKECYEYSVIDKGRGPANIYHFTYQGKDILVAANRETDEIAMYRIEENSEGGELCWKR